MNRRFVVFRIAQAGLAGVLLVGCGDSNLDRVANGAGCLPDAVPGSLGRCPADQLVCEIGVFDQDRDPQNGCEAALDPSGEFALFSLRPGALASLIVNGSDPVNVGVADGWVAFTGPVGCIPIPSQPCNYDLLAAQVGLGGFSYDSLSWTNGTIAVPKPLAVVDAGSGLFIPAESGFVASFAVDGQKRVVSRSSDDGATVTTDGTELIFVVGGMRFPFGAYTIENMIIVAEGQRVAAIEPGMP